MPNRPAPANKDSLLINHPKARELFEYGYEEQINGNINSAMSLYSQSIELCPSAPAYTYLGWAHAQLGEIEKAIDLCKSAIDINKDYGNPHNDIGAYYLEIGEVDEAIEWLEQSILCKIYDCRYFPYFNLGKAYHSKNMLKKAISCYQRSLSIKGDFEPAQEGLDALLNQLN